MSALVRTVRPGALTGLCALTTALRYPMFALAARREPIHFRGTENETSFFIRVESTDEASGLATLADGDVLAVFTTKLVHRLNLGEPLNAPLVLTPGALLRALGRDVGGRQHKLLLGQIHRLSKTQVMTDLGGAYSSFPLIEEVAAVRHDGRASLCFTTPPFLAGEVERRRFLRINPAALKLRGIERKLHDWARAYLGRHPSRDWILDLQQAHARAASLDAPRRFRAAVDEIVLRNRLPGYMLTYARHHGRRCLQIAPRGPPSSAAELSLLSDSSVGDLII